MGQFSQVAQPQTNQPQGKGPISQVAQAAQQNTQQFDDIFRPVGKSGQTITFPGQSGQPQYGQPNRYSNTVGPWDNANIQQPVYQAGKGKGR